MTAYRTRGRNDLTDPKTLAHLLKYDSILGNLPHKTGVLLFPPAADPACVHKPVQHAVNGRP